MNRASRPRLLLRRLHTVMAGSGSGQQRLDKVVVEIARNMVAEVCSVYLLRSNNWLELYATEGLKKKAVHKTGLKVGEGLVGLIAEHGIPLNLPEASEHPKFVYLPETGEEIFHSLMGVPIVRNGEVVGVLVVQNATQRHYTGEELEALQTVAMVLAELVGSGQLVKLEDLPSGQKKKQNQMALMGRKFADGLARGSIVFHEPKIEIVNLVAEDVGQEKRRLQDALLAMREQLDQMMSAADIRHKGEHHEIFEAYKMFAYDRGWQEKITEAINSGLTAEAAVERVLQNLRSQMAKTRDPYLKERLADLEDLSNRLIRIILGFSGAHAHHELVEDAIVVAKTMGPAELLDYKRRYLKGIVLQEGSSSAHVSIVARALSIPMIGRVGSDLDEISEGDPAIIDAEVGRVIIRPSKEAVKTYNSSLDVRRTLAAEYEAQKDLPSVTRDGISIELMMNAGLVIDLPNLEVVGASGIGLFRTEFQFMVSSTLPKMDVQTDLYSKVLDAAGDKPVIFRTLDIGGDKPVPFIAQDDEENTAMGWRAIRLLLDRPVLLRYQLRALLAAAEGRELNVMFPMVAELSEFIAARKIVDRELQRFDKLGKLAPLTVKVGCMLEVPSLAWQLEALLEEADFLSIGTNDLMQFFFASDRSNPRTCDRYDLLSPAVLGFLKGVADAAAKAGKPLTICGEMGGHPLEAMALLAVGVRRFSMAAPAIGPVRMLIRSINLEKLKTDMEPYLQTRDHSLRSWLENYAKENSFPV